MSTLHVKVRSPAAVVGLSILTLSIYSCVWYYKVNRELRDFGRARFDPELRETKPVRSVVAITLGAWLLVPALWSMIATVWRIQAAERLAERTPRSGGPIVAAIVANTTLTVASRFFAGSLALVAAVAALVAFLAAIGLMQARLNGVWRSEGLGARDEEIAVDHGPRVAL